MTSIATWPAKYVLPVELVIVLVFAAWPSPASANDMCDTACFDDCGDGFGVCNEGSAEICEDAGEYLDEELDGNEDAGERYGNRVPGGFELCFRIMETCGKDFYYCNEQCDPLPADCFEDEEKEDDEKEGDEKEGDEKDGEKQGEEESAEGVKDSKGSGGGSGGGSGSASGGGSGSGSGGASGGGSGGASGGGSGSGSGSDAGGESGPGSGDGAGDDGSGGDWSDGPPPIPGWPPAGGGGNNNSNNNINICVGDGACSSGDPHLKSQDGIRFDFQGAGEYHFVLSDEHDIDVQVRYEPAGASEYVSLTTALAARVGPNRITVEIGRTPPLEINGDPVTIRSGLGGALAHESGIIIDRFDTIYRINMSRGVVIKVGVYSNAMNTEVISREHPVAGLGGSNDGNRDNEFTTRDGVTLSPGYGGLTYEQLYRQFGDSWRIEQEDSLFDYEGETSTATYTNLDFPKDKLDIDTMDAAARRRAEEICREAGVRPGPDFENCVYDVGFTDDPVYAAGYARRTISTIATLDAPAEVVAGSTVAVQWTGPANENDMITLAGAEDPGNRWRASAPLDETGEVELKVPGIAGDYELRYVLNEGRRVIEAVPLTVSAVTATVEAPATVAAGSKVVVRWTGPANENDMIALAGAEDPGNRWRASAPLDETGEVELKVPGIPGDYELRYIVSSDRQIAASQALTVTPVTATVEAPATVAAGSKVVVRWTGPANENDMIALAGAEDPGNRWRASAPLDETGEVELKVPGIPGDYELRYIVITDRQIAASQALAVQPVTATLDAPDAVAAGAKVAVRWTGPGNENDFVTLAETGTPGNQWFSFTTVSAAEGTTELKAPDEPGDYVLRYVLNSDRQIVAEIPLTVN